MFATRPSAYQILRHDVRKFPRLSYRPVLYGDNGVDPILGPPYPPVNYQLSIHQSTQPRLTWTVPDLILNLSVLLASPNSYKLIVTNQEWADWDNGTAYIENSRVLHNNLRYFALTDNTGKPPDENPTYWELDDTTYTIEFKRTISGGLTVNDSDFTEANYDLDEEFYTTNLLTLDVGWTIADVATSSGGGYDTEVTTSIIWKMSATRRGTTVYSALIPTTDTFYVQ